MIPVGDFFHTRQAMKKNSYKRSGVYSSVRLQMVCIEVFRVPFKGYGFWRQSVEVTKCWLALIDTTDAIFEDELEAICRAKGLDPALTDPRELLAWERGAR